MGTLFFNIASGKLLNRMRSVEEAPWGGPDFDPRRLAALLRPFGIRSKVFRDGDSTPRGYEAAKMCECALRYKGGLSVTSATRIENKDLGINNVADVADKGLFCEGVRHGEH
jgi:Protein of unknown function (DUF3631)